MDLDVLFVGTAGSAPAARRGLPALLVRRGGDRLLFDCGEGTQRQLLRSVGLVDVDSVFITHFHADHWLGLPGMLKSLALRERSAPLTVYGPRGLAIAWPRCPCTTAIARHTATCSSRTAVRANSTRARPSAWASGRGPTSAACSKASRLRACSPTG